MGTAATIQRRSGIIDKELNAWKEKEQVSLKGSYEKL